LKSILDGELEISKRKKRKAAADPRVRRGGRYGSACLAGA